MNTRRLLLIAFAFLLIATVPVAASASHSVASLRLDEPLEAVVADLESFVPAYMEQEGVPGVSPEAARPNAAGTIRATAADMARFLIEIADPQHLSPETAAEMRTPQVPLRWDLSWGLGPGIQHSPKGDALWQWGQAFDFRA